MRHGRYTKPLCVLSQTNSVSTQQPRQLLLHSASWSTSSKRVFSHPFPRVPHGIGFCADSLASRDLGGSSGEKGPETVGKLNRFFVFRVWFLTRSAPGRGEPSRDPWIPSAHGETLCVRAYEDFWGGQEPTVCTEASDNSGTPKQEVEMQGVNSKSHLTSMKKLFQGFTHRRERWPSDL